MADGLTPCPVQGCHGSLDELGNCPACAHRTAWDIEHRAINNADKEIVQYGYTVCSMCGSRFRVTVGRRGRKATRCKACRVVANRVNSSNAAMKRRAGL